MGLLARATVIRHDDLTWEDGFRGLLWMWWGVWAMAHPAFVMSQPWEFLKLTVSAWWGGLIACLCGFAQLSRLAMPIGAFRTVPPAVMFLLFSGIGFGLESPSPSWIVYMACAAASLRELARYV